jgi:hypothetical protein
MSQDLFERAAQRFDPPAGAWERFGRRRDRKRRNERIASGVLALIVAAAAIGALVAAFHKGEQHEPATPSITSGNVSSLKLAWSADLDSPASAVTNNFLHVTKAFPPTAVDGAVYVETDTSLYAFDATCGTGGTTCGPLWVADTGTGPSTPPVVADGVVYVTRVGQLYAFAADCGTGGVTCTPRWTADTGRAFDPPVVAGGNVYEIDAVNGTVYAFRVDCATGGSTCPPLWTAPIVPTNRQPALAAVARFGNFRPAVSGGVVYAVAKANDRIDRLYAFDAGTGARLWLAETPHPHGRSIDTGNTPVVAGGLVFVDFGDTLYAFPASCRTDGGDCDPAWTWTYPGLTGHAISPVVAGGIVYLGTFSNEAFGRTYAFPVDCGSGGVTCEPIWTAADDGWGDVIVGDDLVIATSNGSSRLDAYPASCGTGGATCETTWRATTSGAPTAVVANGVVYVGADGGVGRVGGRLYAFPTSCSSSGGECQPAWTSPKSGGWMSPPSVDGPMLFATAASGSILSWSAPSGKLYAFGLGGNQRGLTPSQQHDTAVFYIVVAIVLGALLLLRVRRRRATPQLRM